ncbi:MAG: 16S rRNA (cytidine(1402)-2'-O)-methyltransferase, partial [Clostridia bacterium]|nr:16S rRNA (cytidine(1402)-2'-O)-methyltransferase [Clostridia bacterium]
GEYVIIMAGAEKSASAAEYPEDPAEHVAQLMESGMGRMDAIKAAAKARGVSKNEIYSAVAVKDED